MVDRFLSALQQEQDGGRNNGTICSLSFTLGFHFLAPLASRRHSTVGQGLPFGVPTQLLSRDNPVGREQGD